MPDAVSTEPNDPTTRPSDEADKKQLEQAKAEGAKYLEAVNYMAEEVADTGGKTEAGDYLVAFAQEGAEGMYHLTDDGLEWKEPESGLNCHIEIAVMDVVDHRFIPYLEIDCRLRRGDAQTEVSFRPQFLWHAGLFHYGANIELPGDGSYDLDIHIAPPDFPRHDKTNGKRYRHPVDVTFRDVKITTSRG